MEHAVANRFASARGRERLEGRFGAECARALRQVDARRQQPLSPVHGSESFLVGEAREGRNRKAREETAGLAF
jgi:hypothetical protein